MKLEIVSHCWYYWPQLTYQLSSLVLFPPTVAEVTMTLFYCKEDQRTEAVAEYFSGINVKHVKWSLRNLPKEKLFRRSIGRNLAGLQTIADWIWFADADMCFRRGCIDGLSEIASNASGDLIFPRTIQISKTHAAGDATLDKVGDLLRVLDLDPTDFVAHQYGRAIGGVQIVRGETARRLGYNQDSRAFQRPVARWKHTEDVAFRRSLRSSGEPVEIPELYRIRHARYGRRDEFGALI